METIVAIIEPNADGTLHLPLPEALRHGKVAVTATLSAVPAASHAVPVATPDMLARRMEALDRLRELGGLSDVIPDPVAWQREQREDRPLPGRE